MGRIAAETQNKKKERRTRRASLSASLRQPEFASVPPLPSLPSEARVITKSVGELLGIVSKAAGDANEKCGTPKISQGEDETETSEKNILRINQTEAQDQLSVKLVAWD
jgi:hypothetical protein